MNKNIATKLGLIQQSLFVPKGQKNDFGGYNYRSCEDILKAVKPLLEENKCALYMTSDTRAVGSWVYVFAKATLVDIESGETIEAESQAREPEMRKGMDAAQVSGSSLSYARKYALAGLFGIDNEKDPDATNDHDATKPKVTADQILKTNPKPKPDKKHKAWALYKALPQNEGVDVTKMGEMFKNFCLGICEVETGKMSDADWDHVCDAIKAL